MVSFISYTSLIVMLFLIGLQGLLFNRKNILLMLMSIELMLLATNFNWVFFAFYLDDLVGQIFAILVLTVAAAESAIGLALLVVYYRIRGTISVELLNLMQG
uniref:NADH dehydrogenase subunit 4L n=1 Tax=Pseudoerythrocladia kornmannii TaxID=753682 RepID=UPI001FCE1EB0|nr:NADH dehydrogenase subunit 4L [Pseudoerythrocladia kornmannii]UNJ19032.1 NADH dehydrogenase subunit 4L [Pseudoerythrocladia kornmannii]